MKIKPVMTIVLLSAVGLFSGCGNLIKLIDKSSSPSVGSYSALVSKKEELANLQPTGTPSLSEKETPKIKGKVVIVTKDADGEIKLDRFSDDQTFSDEPASKFSPFYPTEVYAKNPEEIDTLIKIECRKFKGEDLYTYDSNSFGEMKEYTNTICNVFIIDYKTKTLLAKIQKGDESRQVILDAGLNKSEVIEGIANYLKSLPLELIPNVKPTPNGEVLAVAEIAKQFKQSKEKPTQYQDKEITLTGWGYLIKPFDRILLYGNEKRSGINFIMCEIDSKDAVDFADLKVSENYKFTVIGKFNSQSSMTLKQCRLINAEQVI